MYLVANKQILNYNIKYLFKNIRLKLYKNNNTWNNKYLKLKKIIYKKNNLYDIITNKNIKIKVIYKIS